MGDCKSLRNGLKWLAFAVLPVFFALFPNQSSAQVDVTDKVRKNTPLAQKIRDFCADYCQGNKREGRLGSVTLRPLGNGRFRGVMTADLRNWQEMEEPLSVTVFDWTVRVRAEGVLDSASCTFVVETVTVHNDPYGLLEGVLDNPKGQRVQVANCRRLLP
ncbi:MAG: hypothetical protein AB9873_15800 [Syntrophobacteraceae bacterium]